MQSVISMRWRTITATQTGECNSASFSHLSSPKGLNGFMCRFVCSRGLFPNACQHLSVSTVRVWKNNQTAHRMSDCVLGVMLALFITINAIKPNGYSKEAKARISSTGSVKPVKWDQGGITDAYTRLTIFCLDLLPFDKSSIIGYCAETMKTLYQLN